MSRGCAAEHATSTRAELLGAQHTGAGLEAGRRVQRTAECRQGGKTEKRKEIFAVQGLERRGLRGGGTWRELQSRGSQG